MASPSVVSRTLYQGPASDASTASVISGANLSGGNFAVALVVSDGAPALSVNAGSTSGWSKVDQFSSAALCTIGVFKKANPTGSETLVIDSDNAEQFVGQVYLVDDADNIAAAGSSGSSGVCNPPSLDIGSSQDVLWLAVRAPNAGNSLSAAGPTGYGNLSNRTGASTANTSACIQVADKQSTGQTEDPGNFGSATNPWCGVTVGIWKVGASGVTGSASGDIPFTGSSAGTVKVQGSASGTVSFTGSTSGAVRNTGTASGTLDLTGSTSGTLASPAITGEASGSIGLSATSSGTVRVSGSASGTLPLSGSAEVSDALRGTSAGDLGLSGSASATVAVKASASGSIALTGSAGAGSGAVPLHGNASDSVAFTGSAEGVVQVDAAAAGSISFGGSATAAVRVLGAANDNLDFTGSAAGIAGVRPAVALDRVGSVERPGRIGATFGANREGAVHRRARSGGNGAGGRVGKVYRSRRVA